ncbi:hypothetical protein [Streptomyces sp. LUP47B]|uniref:hypothetical protein n=1 Tax=Streptomyces sp. LUP47B TaxID=1890286 RepID=UPI00114CA4C6|nr:hypothetical protein [Streptomyces sp. LUP47B]
MGEPVGDRLDSAKPAVVDLVAAAGWCWSLDWRREDGTPVLYTGGRAPSPAAARWRAQWATQNLLTELYRAKSPVSGDPLITPR